MKRKPLIIITIALLCVLGAGTVVFANLGMKAQDTPPAEFDWEQLNTDGLDLAEYEEVATNTPVKLVGKPFETQERDYYMFIGRTNYGNYYNVNEEDFEVGGSMYANLGTDKMLPLLSPNLIGVTRTPGNSTRVRIFNYTYNQTQTALSQGAAASFDIGEMDTETGAIKSSNQPGEVSTSTDPKPDFTYIAKEYVKENDLVAYGWTKRTDSTWLPIRVHYYFDASIGNKVTLDVSFLNQTDSEQYYAVTYASHMDVGGAHMNSKMYSNGEDGIYFNQSKTPVDQLDAQVFFFMGEQNYGDKNGPTRRKLGNWKISSGIGHWANSNTSMYPLYGDRVLSTSPYENWDKVDDRGYYYPLSHPVFILGWEPIAVKAGDVGTATMDVFVKENIIERKLEVDYVDEAGKKIAPSKTLTINDSEEYSEEPIEITDYDYKRVGAESDPISGIITADLHIVFVYDKAYSTVTIHYLDDLGATLEADKIIEAQIGTAYHESPADIPGYEHFETIGNVSGTITMTPQEVSFIYRKDTNLLHMRQVILTKNENIIVPNSGRIAVWNTKDESINDIASKLTYSINAGMGEVSFTEVEMKKSSGYPYIHLNPTLPSFYQYAGAVVTTTDVSHNANDKTDAIPVLSLADGAEYWVTFYLEPVVDSGVYLNVVNNRLNVYYADIDGFTVYIDGGKYKSYTVTNKPSVESLVLDIPISEVRNKVSVEYQNLNGEIVTVYWNNTWDFVEDHK